MRGLWRQQDAVRAIEEEGGYVRYEDELDPSSRRMTRPQRCQPSRLRAVLGFDDFANVASAKVGPRSLARVDGLPALRILDASGIQKVPSGFSSVRNLRHLETLFLDGSGINDDLLVNLESACSLRRLSLRGTLVTSHGLTHLGELVNLKDLDLSDTQVTSDGFELIKKLTQLELLDLSGTSIGDDGLRHLKNLGQLEVLDLSCTPIAGSGLSNLKDLPHLRKLYVGDTKITNAAIVYIKDFAQLVDLDMAGTKVTGEGLLPLRKLSQLRRLSVPRTVSERERHELRLDLPDLIIDERESGPRRAEPAEIDEIGGYE